MNEMRILNIIIFIFVCCSTYAQETFDFRYIKTYGDHKIPIERVVFSLDNKHIISGDFNGQVYFWNKNSDAPVHEKKAHNNRINNISFSNDGRFMATASSDRTAKVWTYPEMKLVKTYNSDHNISFILFHPDSRQVYFGGQDGSIYKHKFLKKTTPYPIFHNPYFITSATYSPDKKHLVFSSGYSIKFLNINTSRIEKEIGSCSDFVNQIVFTPGGSLISWCEDGSLNYWDYRHGYYGLLYSKKAGDSGYSNLVASNDNKFLLTGNSDYNIRIWDLSTKTMLGELKGHMDVVRSFAFSRGNQYIATCSYDGNIILWGTPYKYEQEKKKILAQKEAADKEILSTITPKDPMLNKTGNNKTTQNPITALNDLLTDTKISKLKPIKDIKTSQPKLTEDITLSEKQKPKASKGIKKEVKKKMQPSPHFKLTPANLQALKPEKKGSKLNINIKPKRVKPIDFEKTDRIEMKSDVENYIAQMEELKIKTSNEYDDVLVNKVIDFEKKNTPTAIDNRKVVTSRTIAVNKKSIDLFVWDNMKVDGDQISLMMNGSWILKKHTLSESKYKLNIKIDPHSNNYLVLYAHNLGTQPPNTAALRFHDGTKQRELLLKSDLGECGAINFVYMNDNGVTGYNPSK